MSATAHIHSRPCFPSAASRTKLGQAATHTLYIPVTSRLYLDAPRRDVTLGRDGESGMQTRRAGEGGSGSGETRAQKVVAGTADNDNAPIVMMTRGELRALVAAAAAEATRQVPLLVDKQQLARQLGCSAPHIDHLRKQGLPWVPVGQAVRFEPAAVVDWLRQRGAPHNDQE